MATESSTEAPSPGRIDVCGIPTIIRWDNDQQRGVGSSLSSTPVSLDIDLDSSTATASFRLRIALHQRGSDKTIPVFLLIESQEILSVATNGPDQIPDGATPSSSNTVCLQILLKGSSTLIVPPEPLRLKDKSQLSLLRSVRWAARQSTLMVHFHDQALSQHQITALVETPYQQFTSSLRHSDIGRLYGGRGGKVFDAGADDAPNDQPPSYNQVAPPPPMAPSSSGPDTAASPKKRRRIDEPAAEEVNMTLVEMLCKKIADEQYERIRAELLTMETRIGERIDRSLRDRVGDLSATWESRFEKLESQLQNLRSEFEANTQELRDGSRELDDSMQAELQRLDDLVQEVSDDIDHRVDFEIEDRVLGIKADMEDFVKDEISNAADTLKRRITEASVYIEFQE